MSDDDQNLQEGTPRVVIVEDPVRFDWSSVIWAVAIIGAIALGFNWLVHFTANCPKGWEIMNYADRCHGDGNEYACARLDDIPAACLEERLFEMTNPLPPARVLPQIEYSIEPAEPGVSI